LEGIVLDQFNLQNLQNEATVLARGLVNHIDSVWSVNQVSLTLVFVQRLGQYQDKSSSRPKLSTQGSSFTTTPVVAMQQHHNTIDDSLDKPG
jgi:hypothetical protein